MFCLLAAFLEMRGSREDLPVFFEWDERDGSRWRKQVVVGREWRWVEVLAARWKATGGCPFASSAGGSLYRRDGPCQGSRFRSLRSRGTVVAWRRWAGGRASTF